MSQHPQLDEAVKKLKELGHSDEAIKQQVLAAGWTIRDFRDSLASLSPQKSQSISQPEQATFSDGQIVIKHDRPFKKILVIILVVLVILGLAFSAFALIGRFGLFSSAPFSEDNFVSGVFNKVSQIESSELSLAVSLQSEPREEKIKAFDPSRVLDEGLNNKYERDYKRWNHLQDILEYLVREDSLPASYSQIDWSARRSFNGERPKDPLTGADYIYRVTENGNNFEIEVTFEHPYFIQRMAMREDVKKLGDGVFVFDKDTNPWEYYPSSSPSSYFEGLNKMGNYLPSDLNVNGQVTVAADLSDAEKLRWKVNLGGSGDFSDLSYKVDIESLFVDENFYLKINNLPSLFFMEFLPPKGQWVELDLVESGIVPIDLKEIEAEFVDKKDQFVIFLTNVLNLADEEGVIIFLNEPRKENIDGRSLYRYDLGINKDSLKPFYERIIAEAGKEEYQGEFDDLDDTLLQYLEGEQFDYYFDFYQNSTELTVWVDKEGYPAIVDYKIKFVPAEDSGLHKDRQFVISIRLNVSDINKPINIGAPEGAKKMEDIFGLSELSDGRNRAIDASAQASMSSMRAEAELAVLVSGKYPADLCGNALSGLIESVEEYYPVVCNTNTSDWAAEVVLSEGDRFCVDSSGFAGESVSALGSANLCFNNELSEEEKDQIREILR